MNTFTMGSVGSVDFSSGLQRVSDELQRSTSELKARVLAGIIETAEAASMRITGGMDRTLPLWQISYIDNARESK